MEIFVVAYYRLRGPYRGVVLAFPTEIPEGETLAELAAAARADIASRQDAPFRVELVALATYDPPAAGSAHRAALEALRDRAGQGVETGGASPAPP
jgi:hypothetical protein